MGTVPTRQVTSKEEQPKFSLQGQCSLQGHIWVSQTVPAVNPGQIPSCLPTFLTLKQTLPFQKQQEETEKRFCNSGKMFQCCAIALTSAASPDYTDQHKLWRSLCLQGLSSPACRGKFSEEFISLKYCICSTHLISCKAPAIWGIEPVTDANWITAHLLLFHYMTEDNVQLQSKKTVLYLSQYRYSPL